MQPLNCQINLQLLEKLEFKMSFIWIILNNINLTDTNLTDINLTDNNLTDINMTDLNLTDINLTGINLTDINLTEINLTEIEHQVFELMKNALLAKYYDIQSSTIK